MSFVELAVMVGMVIFNGLFAGYEIALAAVTIARLQILVRENRAGAKAALYMKQNMEASLAAMQVAMTLLAAIAAAVGGTVAAEGIKPFLTNVLDFSSAAAEVIAIIFIVVPLTFFSILFGELMPKVFSLRNKEWVCLRLSPVMRWFCFSVWPAVWVFETAVMSMIAWSERRWRPHVNPGAKREAIEMLELLAHAASARASRLIGEREEKIILARRDFPAAWCARLCCPPSTLRCSTRMARWATAWSRRIWKCTPASPSLKGPAIPSRSWATSTSRTWWP